MADPAAAGELAMRWVPIGLGVLLSLIGAVWTLQGLNVLPGSIMTGQPFWAGAGIVTLLAGLGLIVIGLRRPPAS